MLAQQSAAFAGRPTRLETDRRAERDTVGMDDGQGSPLLARLDEWPPTARLLDAARAHPGVHLVGGAVRDLLREARPVDLDVVVEGDALAFAQLLADPERVHERFGTLTLDLDGQRLDVSRARRETYASPGALPDVAPATIDEDLERRDFTINTLALGLSAPEAGRLRAVAGAREDLRAGTLRVLHDGSFADDPTRLLRLARYAGRLGFEAEPATRALADGAIEGDFLDTVSGARIGVELALTVRDPAADAALDALRSLGVGSALHARFRWQPELATRALALVPDGGRADLVRLACCCTRFEREELRAWLDHLAWPATDRDVVVDAAVDTAPLADALLASTHPSQIARAAGSHPVEALAVAGGLGAEVPARRWLERDRKVALAITGDDLRAAGLPEGPEVGRALQSVLDQRLDGELDPGRDAELAAALRAVEGSGGG